MDHYAVAKQYYARWVDVPAERLDEPGLHIVQSPERDRRQRGYGQAFDVYCLILPATTVVSYGEAAAGRIDGIADSLASSDNVEASRTALSAALGRPVGQANKYRYAGPDRPIECPLARRLEADDYPRFLGFHRELYPNARQDEWLEAYYLSVASRGYAYGVLVDGKLVCATEAPDIPYMDDLIVEPGINTLPAHRRRGYARQVVAAMVQYVASQGKTPVWSCAASNEASQRLAESVGFVHFGDVLTVTHEATRQA